MADVLLVSLGSTAGLRASDAELAASIERAGASVEVATAPGIRPVRTFALTDLAWARAARAAALEAVPRVRPRAVIYSTITAALLAPAPGAIRFDALAARNRPGRHGVWQRPRERGVLARAPLLLPVREEPLAGAPPAHAAAIVVPIRVEASGPPLPEGERDIAAITYAADAHKKGLDRVLAAWAAARREGEELLVAGLASPLRADGVRAIGVLERGAYRALLRRARIYIAAPRREEYGIAQLEALADGALLVSAAGVPYPALALARAADARLVGEELAVQIRTALDDPLPGYARAVAPLLEPFSAASVDRLVAERVLPALLGGV
jgi:glycosyltransferase involved in cell wall biosynthesis